MRFTLLAVAALAIAACEGPAGPEGPSGEDAETVTVTVSGPSTVAPGQTGDTFFCDVALDAVATGAPGAVARWVSGTITLDAETSISSVIVLDSAEVVEVWGAPSITTGQTRNSGTWRFSRGDRFRLLQEFRYRIPSGAMRETSQLTDCTGT